MLWEVAGVLFRGVMVLLSHPRVYGTIIVHHEQKGKWECGVGEAAGVLRGRGSGAGAQQTAQQAQEGRLELLPGGAVHLSDEPLHLLLCDFYYNSDGVSP